ncbi:MAG: hypothetical protein WEB59_06085 [Thermoanaerobaculia bacterium]
MSLIDDALKRAQAAGQPDAGPPADRPWVPAPLPDAGLARRRRLVRLLAIGFGLGAVAAVAVWMVRKTATEASRPPAGEAQVEKRAPEPAALLPAAAVPAASAPSTQVSAKPRSARPAAPAGQEPGEAAEASPDPNPTAPRPQALADGKTYAGAIMLPDGARVELGGIVWSEAEPRALLNDRIAGVGAWVEGFTVAKIEPERVALEKDGLTIYLSLK